MTVVDVSGSVDELAEGMGGSVDAVTGRRSIHIGNPGLETMLNVVPYDWDIVQSHLKERRTI